jgi:outer membrane protein TolC
MKSPGVEQTEGNIEPDEADMIKYLLTATLTLLSPRALAAGSERSSQESITFDTFVEAVLSHHPQRSIDEISLARAKEGFNRAGVLSDPQIKIGRDEVPFRGRLQPRPEMADMAKENAQWRLEFSQSLPWPGALAAEERVAQSSVANIETNFGVADLIRRFEAQELYLGLIRTDKVLMIEKANFLVVDGVSELTQAKFRQGIGSHYEFLQAHSERGVLKANVASLETELLNLKRHALLLMGSPNLSNPEGVSFVLDWPSSLTGPDLAQNKGSQDFARLKIQREKELEIARQDAAYRRSLPSLMASGMVMEEDSGMRMYGAMVGVSLPVFSQIQRNSLKTEGSLTQTQAEQALSWHERRKSLALMQADSRIAQIQANYLALEREIIPPVKDHIEAVTVQFSQGKSDITAIIAGRRTLLNLEISKVRMMEALARARLSIEKIQAGLIDEELDLDVPQLVGASSNMGMTGGGSPGMSPMTSGKDRMPMKPRQPGMKAGPETKIEDEPDGPAQQGKSPGMDM